MDVDRLVESKIREAQEQGLFDNLAPRGQLGFEDESGVPEDMRMAFRMLKSQGMAPDWIEQDKALRSRMDEARQALARTWAWRRRQLNQATDADGRARIEQEWQRARARFEQVIGELNAEVFSFNLRVPALSLQRRPIRASEEYGALGIEP